MKVNVDIARTDETKLGSKQMGQCQCNILRQHQIFSCFIYDFSCTCPQTWLQWMLQPTCKNLDKTFVVAIVIVLEVRCNNWNTVMLLEKLPQTAGKVRLQTGKCNCEFYVKRWCQLRPCLTLWLYSGSNFARHYHIIWLAYGPCRSFGFSPVQNWKMLSR